jgi:hypothetical protein
MSFGWSTGDIASAIAVLVKVGKALRNTDGATSEYQETVEFIKSLVKTLESIKTIFEQCPDLEWKDSLAEQAKAMNNAIEVFKKKIEKYDLSLGVESSRRKSKRIPREVQFALSADVKELRVAVTQPFQVMGFWVNRQTL